MNSHIGEILSDKKINQLHNEKVYLQDQAEKHVNLLLNYQNSKNVCSSPSLKIIPPIIPNSNPVTRYNMNQWNVAINDELNLIKDKQRLISKMNNVLFLYKNNKS